MIEALEQLEAKRHSIYQEMDVLGDFRPGIISVNFRKCGKKRCVCTSKGHPGHGPQYLWNTTQGGNNRGQNLRLGPELEKVRKEVESYKKFNQLCQEAVAVNEKICRIKPVPEVSDQQELEALKKKLRRNFLRKQKRKSSI